jgi:hypothetical protein
LGRATGKEHGGRLRLKYVVGLVEACRRPS